MTRELDALVAEKVMGWEVEPVQDGYDAGYWRIVKGESAYERENIPSYSTSIADAWMVVEKFPSIEIHTHEHGGVSVRVDAYCYGNAPTAPEAICKAALRAVGVET